MRKSGPATQHNTDNFIEKRMDSWKMSIWEIGLRHRFSCYFTMCTFDSNFMTNRMWSLLTGLSHRSSSTLFRGLRSSSKTGLVCTFGLGLLIFQQNGIKVDQFLTCEVLTRSGGMTDTMI